MPKDWVIPPPWSGRDGLAAALRISPVVAQVLFNRGIGDVEAARGFLDPRLADILPPEALAGTTAAADRIAAAVADGEKIVIFGDYDVDGITGVSILWHCLRLAGAEPEYYIPHRLDEGYGIGAEPVSRLHQFLGNQRPAERGCQRVLLLIKGTGKQGREAEIGQKYFP